MVPNPQLANATNDPLASHRRRVSFSPSDSDIETITTVSYTHLRAHET